MSGPAAKSFVAVDPGRDKCGLAAVSDGRLVWREICRRQEVMARLLSAIDELNLTAVVVGDRTGSRNFCRELTAALAGRPVAIVTVDEHRSSEEARQRYWRDHPRRGWRRWLPAGLLVPPRPVDDYAAEVLAERYRTALSEGRDRRRPGTVSG
ncbi:MAG: hypothetical protein N3A57_04980 [Negativicutes bacterium]|nr:hypothetical protein [Negativicutes bacterium]